MATVSIARSWGDDDVVQVTVSVDASYPDAVNEAKAAAVDAYGKALRETIAAEMADAPEDGDA